MTHTYSSVLFDENGHPLSVAGSVIAPAALNHAAVWELPGHLHPFRSDESLRANPEDAKAMRRRAFHARLMQERTAQTVVLKWKPVVPNPDDPLQRQVQDALTEAWEDFPDKINAHEQLLEMVWYGRAGLQVEWAERANGKPGVVYHEPVHGDSIQFDWAGTPVLLVSQQSARRFERDYPNSVLPPGEVTPEVVKGSDRGAYGLKLNHPALRRRFVLAQFRREAADYFDGDMSGRIHGTGLRDRAFWTDKMLVQAEVGMLNFLFSTGMMDLLLFNYLSGNPESERAARQNAEKITGKIALLNPVTKDEYARRGPIEQISMNAAGIEALRGVIQDLYMVQEEHLFVGQSMSTGQGGGGGLEGSGKAEFAESTKTALQKADAARLQTTWTRDWAIPQRDFLFPGSKIPVQMVPIFEDESGAAAKFDRGIQLVQAGVPVEVEELRECAGFREPRPGKPTIGGAAAVPGVGTPAPTTPANPAAPNPALPPGKPEPTAAAPNPVLPPGNPGGGSGLGGPPNPALPPGRATAPPAGDPSNQASDDEIVDAAAAVVEALNDALGTPGQADRAAILAKVQAGRSAPAPTQYRLAQAPFSGGVWDEGRHRWVLPKDGSEGGRATTPAADKPDLSAIAGGHAAELADPATAEAAAGFLDRAYLKVAEVLFRFSPAVIAGLEAVFDTPADMAKFGYNPTSTSQTSSPQVNDPVRNATGINAHLAATIASHALAFAFVKAKRAVTGGTASSSAPPRGPAGAVT